MKLKTLLEVANVKCSFSDTSVSPASSAAQCGSCGSSLSDGLRLYLWHNFLLIKVFITDVVLVVVISCRSCRSLRWGGLLGCGACRLGPELGLLTGPLLLFLPIASLLLVEEVYSGLEPVPQTAFDRLGSSCVLTLLIASLFGDLLIKRLLGEDQCRLALVVFEIMSCIKVGQ